MKIGESIKEQVNNTFVHSKFVGRDPKTILAILNASVHGSDNMHVIPKVQDAKVNRIDDLHDELSLLWDDYSVEGIITWRPSTDNRNVIFVSFA